MLIKEIPQTSSLVTTPVPNMKIIEEVENKIPNILEKYFTTADYNRFTSDILDAKIKQEFVNKSDLIISNLR